jgi:chromosomal replication initiation ATPase DnaA
MDMESNKETPREKNLRQVGNIAAHYKITRCDILGPSRFKLFVNARRSYVNHFIGMNMHPKKIGKIINRDRTTVLYLAGMIKKSKVANKP